MVIPTLNPKLVILTRDKNEVVGDHEVARLGFYKLTESSSVGSNSEIVIVNPLYPSLINPCSDFKNKIKPLCLVYGVYDGRKISLRPQGIRWGSQVALPAP